MTFKKRSGRIWRGLLLLPATVLLFVLTAEIGHSQNRVIGYYPMWIRATLPPQAVKFNYLTHLIHAFSWPLPDGAIGSSDAIVDTGFINTTHRAGRKVLLSFGGASESGNFPSVTADSVVRRTFIQNVVNHLTTYNYDGADLDWEGPQSIADRANELTLVRELRNAFLAAHPEWLITMAVGVTDWSGRWHDFNSLKQYVDWFNAMTYDFHGSWSSHAGPNAPLYPSPLDVNDGSVDQGIAYLNGTRGIPGSQLALGMPFYGRQFLAAAMYAPKTEPTTDLLYSDITNRLAQHWIYTWDSVSQVPYLTSPSRNAVVTFEDSASVSRKCEYAKAKNLSGVMIWELSQDLAATGQPLMDVIGKTMTAPLDIAQSSELTHPKEFVLYNNYPNPFNPSTVVSFELPVVSDVRLAVYDLLGREASVLVTGRKEPGSYTVQLNATGFASGVYFCRLSAVPLSRRDVISADGRNGQAGIFLQTRKMLLVK
jgi:chitinase